MPGEKRTGPNGAVIKTGLQPSGYAKWYKNPDLSDLVIRYGTHGEKEFRGHQVILCSASEWLLKAAKDWKKCTEQTIVLASDKPETLEVLFEHAYTRAYKETTEGTCILSRSENQFSQHLHVFSLADKYQAERLEAYAFRNLEDVVDDFTLMHRHMGETGEYVAPVFYRWMVERIYLHADDYFPVLCESFSPPASNGEAEGTADGSSSVHNPVQMSSSSQSECQPSRGRPGSPKHVRNSPVGDNRDMDEVEKVEMVYSNHPVDRVKRLLIQAAVRVWAGEKSPLERQDLIDITKEIPEFGSDLSAAALQSWWLLPDREDTMEVGG